jgi:hypothetical protein
MADARRARLVERHDERSLLGREVGGCPIQSGGPAAALLELAAAGAQLGPGLGEQPLAAAGFACAVTRVSSRRSTCERVSARPRPSARLAVSRMLR